ncbi:MAG: restriction endonuclease subunit S [Eubacteriales bacterium]|nr:restriction endonuclease subunit S [Eubacteriales bacterium]
METPTIRFKGYTEELESVTAGELFCERKEKGNEALPILSLSIHTGISDHELDDDESSKKVKRSEDKSLYKTVHTHDLAFNMMRAWQGAFGVAMVDGMISPAYIVARPIKEIYPEFLNYYVQTPYFINQANNLSYGVTDFRKRLYWDSFCKIKMNLPIIEEQIKIANLFQEIDEVIAETQKESRALTKKKTGIMRKVFLRQVRFKDDKNNDYPEWIEKTLGEIAELYQPATISKAQCMEDAEYPVFGANGIIGRYNKKNHDNDQVCISCRGANCGFVNYVNAPVWITGNSMVCNVDNNSEINKHFLYHLLSFTNFKPVITGGAQPQLTRDKLRAVRLNIPIMEEQAKIADFLDEFDRIIEFTNQELEKWKLLKKGLMQQMFI